MTMPTMMNCLHSADGICRECAKGLLSEAIMEIRRMAGDFGSIVWSCVSPPCPGEVIWWEVYQRFGERRLLIHGHPNGATALHVMRRQEAFHGGCPGCVGIVADGRIEADLTCRVHMTSGPVRLSITPLREKCDDCRESEAAEAIRDAIRVCRDMEQFNRVVNSVVVE